MELFEIIARRAGEVLDSAKTRKDTAKKAGDAMKAARDKRAR